MRLPDGLAHWRSRPGGAAWLELLPSTLDEVAAAWELDIGEAFEPATVALVVACRAPDGGEAVLKLNGPDADAEHEAAALLAWAGGPVVAVLRHDPARRALLLRHCLPGTQLWAVNDDEAATRIAAGLLGPLLVAPPAGHPFRRLADVADEWQRAIRALADHDAALARTGLDALAELLEAPAGAGDVLLSLDLHGGNVLRDGDGWVAIDPKPVVGDPALAVASLLRDRRWLLGDERADRDRLRRRLDLLEESLGLDRERMRLWGVVHTLAWAADGGVPDAKMLASARILAALDRG